MGNAAREEADKHKIGLFSNMSTAMMEHQSEKRKEALKASQEPKKED